VHNVEERKAGKVSGLNDNPETSMRHAFLFSLLLTTTLAGTAHAGDVVGLGGKCLDVKGKKSDDGTPTQLWQCNGGPNQKWQYTRAGELKGFADKCLDVEGGKTDEGTPVILYTCNGGANQKWRFEKGALVGIGGNCLDVKGNKSKDGQPLVLYRCTGGANQKWKLRG
jgi:hypothetical protein